MNDQNVEKVIVIGSGPAGFTAALYTARANLNPLVLTGNEIGGQVAITYEVENYPGFPEGLTGPEMVEKFQKQAEKFGARIEYDYVSEVDFRQHPFVVRTANEKEYLTEAVIVSTGATPRKLGVPGETEFTGFGVSYCGTCDGFFFRGKEVIVVGGGDSALEEGLFLTKFATKVTVIHRRDELRASKILQDRAMNNPKMAFKWSHVVERINASGSNGNGAPPKVVVSHTARPEERRELRLPHRRRLHLHRPHAQFAAFPRAVGHRRRRLPDHRPAHAHQRARRLCRRRDPGSGLSPGGHLSRPGRGRGHGGREVPGRAGSAELPGDRRRTRPSGSRDSVELRTACDRRLRKTASPLGCRTGGPSRRDDRVWRGKGGRVVESGLPIR